MLEMTNTEVRFQSEPFFLWKLKIFKFFRLSCLLIFVGLGPAKKKLVLLSLSKALCKGFNGAANFVSGFFVLLQFFILFLNKKNVFFFEVFFFIFLYICW